MSLHRAAALGKEVVLLEVALYVCLVRWIARRPDAPRGSTPITYARLSAPMIWLFVFGGVVETVAIEVVLRQFDATWAHLIRLPLLVVGVWGVLWMLGLLASYRVKPHVLDDDRLLLRSGARTWVDVPLDVVARSHGAEHELPGVLTSLHQEDDLLLVGVSSRTNLELRLAGPTTLRTSKGPLVAERVGLWVDEPREVSRLLTRRRSQPASSHEGDN